MNRSILTLCALLCCIILVKTTAIAQTHSAQSITTSPETTPAIQGYDPVAYFTNSAAVKGSKEFSHVWNGKTWQFASANHRSMFKTAPERYAPQYDSYCAYGVSMHNVAHTSDPTAWKIVGGKLYLNSNKKAQAIWEKDSLDTRINRGNTLWVNLAPNISGKQPNASK
jgi:YHS domain-containing protein